MQKSSIQYILKLSIPIFFANLAVPMVGVIDTALMGNLGNLSYLSATSVAANLFSMIFIELTKNIQSDFQRIELIIDSHFSLMAIRRAV